MTKGCKKVSTLDEKGLSANNDMGGGTTDSKKKTGSRRLDGERQ